MHPSSKLPCTLPPVSSLYKPYHHQLLLLLRSLGHGPCQDDDRRRLYELQLVTDLSHPKILVVGLLNPDQLGRLASRDHHLMQCPQLLLCRRLRLTHLLLLVLRYKCLSEMLLVSLLIIQVWVFIIHLVGSISIVLLVLFLISGILLINVILLLLIIIC